ncbi:MAG: PaaI family thioesterase [Burkholderiales bacterium]|nr:PaaI family thioesterase [Burkholderiales bacterium]
MTGKVDHAAARAAFERALAEDAREFGNFFLSRFLGLAVTYPDDDTCVVELDVHDYMFNPQGSLHGGVIATVLDISMGHLLNRRVGTGMTLQMETKFLRPARAGRIRAEGRFLKKGRSINYLETRLTDAGGALLAVANSTWQLLGAAGPDGAPRS